MDKNTETEIIENKDVSFYKNKVHCILAYSYVSFFVAFILGVIFDRFYPLKILPNGVMVSVGIFLFILASILILWAQKTSRNLKKEDLKKENFLQGPYKYSRNPTHWGLFLLAFGFGIAMNSLYIALFTIFSFILSKLVFLRKQESILEKKYGEPYKEYKKSVKF